MTFTFQDLQPLLLAMLGFLAVVIWSVSRIVQTQANAFAKRSTADADAYSQKQKTDAELRQLETKKEHLYLELVNDLRREVTSLKAQSSEQADCYRAEVERGNRLEDDIRQLRDGIATLEQQVTTLTNERDSLKQQLAQARSELDEQKRLRKEAEASQAQEQRERERERKELNVKIANLEGEIDTLRQAIHKPETDKGESDAA